MMVSLISFFSFSLPFFNYVVNFSIGKKTKKEWATCFAVLKLTNQQLLSRKDSGSLMMFLSQDAIVYLGVSGASLPAISHSGYSS